ncbi:MAG TPA: hemolysin family protein [Candidatus Binatia bacterium]|nr:hemolysin family protein [Candidatus Binatia bacterium]
MIWLAGVVLVVVVFASVLAVAETAMSRTSRVRALALRAEGRRNARLLEEIQSAPPRYLNSIYLCVLLLQNGSAILVAMLSAAYFGDLGITLVSVTFTLGYFVVVEAMSKTFGILHSDRAALALAPLVWFLGRALALPTRVLIGIANVLLPGKGLAEGPFVSEQDIRSMAEVGHAQGAIEESERRMIHSIFEFGDTLVRDVMVPRPDVVAVEVKSTLRTALDTMLAHDCSRVPVYRNDLDRVEGILHVKDALKALHLGRTDVALGDLVRPAHFVPETKKATELLREMRREKFHMAIVIDEYGSAAGLVTLEDLLEELVGEIADEHDVEEREVEPLGGGRYRVDASLPIHELSELLATELPRDRWNTVGGLMFGLLGTIPAEGQSLVLGGFRFTAEKVQGRRVTTVLVSPEPPAA